MSTIPEYVVSQDAVQPLIQYCRERGLDRFFLVADPNTLRVLGERVEQSLRSAGIDVKRILLTGEEISADEHYVTQALVDTEGEARPFISVGSGTVTDVTRFVSHRTHTFFLSLPTAPSVDGYTSTVAPLVIGRYKATIAAHAPAAVFADLPTLCQAPRAMIAAGLGDLLGKYTSLADWQLGALLYEEPYDESIDRMMRASVDSTVEALDEVAAASCEGIQRLMDGLIGAGFGMLEFGDSRPASGSEHHIAHYWEMKFIMEGRPAILHGAKVGVATILSARRYQTLRSMRLQDVEAYLKTLSLPMRREWLAEIKQGYGPVSGLIEQIQQPLLEMTPEDLEMIKRRVLSNWGKIQDIARSVPSPEDLVDWLDRLGGPTRPEQIGLSEDEVLLGLRSAHYLRDRFTLNRLGYWLNIPFPSIKPA